MIPIRSFRQRLVLVMLSLVVAQACVALGVWRSWTPFATFASSTAFAAFAGLMFFDGMMVLRSFMAALAGHVVRIGAGDLRLDIQAGTHGEAARVLGALQGLQDELRRSIAAIPSGPDGVAVAATQIANGNHDLSGRTEQTAGNLQQAASSMAQINGTVRHTADSAAQAKQLAGSAAQVAARGGEVVARVVSTMDEINSSSKRIADIIGTIDGIAFQTNILALNAAVEAARAGEQGRGFAVVASEVRSLAQRSAEAAREIKALIGASVERVESGSRLVADAGTTMGEIVASVQRVSDIIGEISSSASEQSAEIGQVNGAV